VINKTVPLEKSITTAILKWLNKQLGCYAIKTHGGPYKAGQPDIIACYHGRMLALEVKRPGNKATKLQQAILAKWEAAGVVTAVVTCVEDVKEILKEVN